MIDWIVSKQTTESPTPAPSESKPEGTIDIVSKPEVAVIPPLSEYEKINHHPYLYDYLKLKDSGIIKDALYDGHYKGMVKEVDDFVISEVNRNKLNPTVDSYKEIMSKIKAYLGIGNNDTPDKILTKLKTYSEVIGKKRVLEERITDSLKKLTKLMGHDHE